MSSCFRYMRRSRAKRREAGLCAVCGKNLSPTFRCEPCQAAVRLYRKNGKERGPSASERGAAILRLFEALNDRIGPVTIDDFWVERDGPSRRAVAHWLQGAEMRGEIRRVSPGVYEKWEATHGLERGREGDSGEIRASAGQHHGAEDMGRPVPSALA